MDTAVPIKAPGIVRVLDGIKPVFVTNKATVVEIRDKFGDLMALFFQQFADDIWVFTTKADEDWEANLIRLGYLNPSITLDELAKASGMKG